MKNILLIITFLCSAFCYGQTFSVNNLYGTKWQRVGIEGRSSTWEFTKSEIKYVTNNHPTKSDRNLYRTNPYYISKTIPDSFDESKIDSNTKGKYLVVKTKKGDRRVYRIDYLSSDSLKLFYIHNGAPMIGIGGITTDYVFKRINSTR